MTHDDKFKQLRQISATPSAEARDAARKAAHSAFLQAHEKKSSHSQGSTWLRRLIHSFNLNLWRENMERKLIGGTALASILVFSGAFVLTQMHGPKPIQIPTIPNQTQETTAEDTSTGTPTSEPMTAETVVAPAPAAPETVNEAVDTAEAVPSEPVTAPVVVEAPAPSAPAKEMELNSTAASRAHSQAKSRKDNAMVNPGASQANIGKSISPAPAAGSEIADLTVAPMPAPQDQNDLVTASTNPVHSVAQDPVSTFSIDVDTANYAYIRNQLNAGLMPLPESVRVEELVNYFDYHYPAPRDNAVPFQPTVTLFQTPWNEETKLMHVAIQGEDIISDEKPRSNLVFLLDVSGSMHSPDKLPLLVKSLKMLIDQLDEQDTISIVTYAGNSGVLLNPTAATEKAKIYKVLDQLSAGGSTAGAAGLQDAYELAAENYDKDAVNRVILATDGDFNVGLSDPAGLEDYIAKKRETGIFLSVLGFGQSGYDDQTMQSLAQNGNGIAAYIDTLSEAQKVLVEEAGSTLYPIAKDVKIQVEFNPAKVAEYRLIGYETRALNREDFNNDKVDAGDIGSGHQVTAIYEITPTESEFRHMDNLRYAKAPAAKVSDSNEYAFLKVRYKEPNADESQLIAYPVTDSLDQKTVDRTSTEVQFSTAVAAFGQKLRQESYVDAMTYADIETLASQSRGEDSYGYRSEFLGLIRLAKSLGK